MSRPPFHAVTVTVQRGPEDIQVTLSPSIAAGRWRDAQRRGVDVQTVVEDSVRSVTGGLREPERSLP